MPVTKSLKKGYFQTWSQAMSKPIVWMHDQAITFSSEFYQRQDSDTRLIYIWDDAYLKSQGYTLKRLVFIYESLIETPVQILKGNTLEVLKDLQPNKVLTFNTPDTRIKALIDKVSKELNLELIDQKSFVDLPNKEIGKRFFKYWNQAKKSAFYIDGKKPV